MARSFSKLTNYLRTYRRRSGFTQAELGFLIGTGIKGQISRFEQLVRVPSSKTLLAYEAVFGVPAKDLFRGFYDSVEKEVARRAAVLLEQLEDQSDALSRRKVELLRSLLDDR